MDKAIQMEKIAEIKLTSPCQTYDRKTTNQQKTLQTPNEEKQEIIHHTKERK